MTLIESEVIDRVGGQLSEPLEAGAFRRNLISRAATRPIDQLPHLFPEDQYQVTSIRPNWDGIPSSR